MTTPRRIDGWECAAADISSLPEAFRTHAALLSIARKPLTEFAFGYWSYCQQWLAGCHEKGRPGKYAEECHAIGTNDSNRPKPGASH